MEIPETPKRPSRKRWKILIGVLLAFLLLLPLLLLVSVSENKSNVSTSSAASPQDAQRVKHVLGQLKYASYYNRPINILISEQDMNSFFRLAERGISRLKGEARVSVESGTTINVSLSTPENPFGNHVNLTVAMPAFSSGVEFKYLKIGQITLTGETALRQIKLFMKKLLGQEQTDTLFHSIKRIRTVDKKLIVTYQPIQNLGEQLANIANLRKLINDNANAAFTNEKIHYYYSQLCQHLTTTEETSLGGLLQQAMSLAAQESESTNHAGMENRAALIASAILFGSYRFNSIVQAVPKQELKTCQAKAPDTTLAKRHDLSLHFIFAAAIKILSDSHISFAVSEFKELSDSLRGGSGFSFTDLAADQTGIRFAELASSDHSDLYLQQQADKLNSEPFFFPKIRDLPEGIPQRQFEQEYGNVEGDRYQQMLDQINQRINALPLYENAP